MRSLEKIWIQNFKSIRDQTLELGRLNLLIGANGSGKSNLIEAFRLLQEIVSQNLARFSLQRGADRLLYLGSRHSKNIELHLTFIDGKSANGYRVTLAPSDEGALFIADEVIDFHDRSKHVTPYFETITSDARESGLLNSTSPIANYLRGEMTSYRIYHFHDTSDVAPMKAPGALHDNRYLRPDASNLAAFLFWMQECHPDSFGLLQETVRQVAPFFDRFSLAPSNLRPDTISLEWKERGSDTYFDAHALSDGSLRFICLTALLLQPSLPSLVLVDEPELGLHPAAITLLAELLSSAAERTQILAATQSVTLVNQFEPEQVWAVEREEGQSVFRHPASADTAGWLDDYGLGDLWEKNRLGARP
jgi:predicted ATPase